MVTGNEYIFPNIDDALEYVLKNEQKALASDRKRQVAPCVPEQPTSSFLKPGMIPKLISVDSLDYPYSGYFNNASSESFVMSRLASGRYSLKPNLCERKYLFRGETEFHSPCTPSLFRKNKQKQYIEELAIGQEMELLMLSHPLVQLLDLGVELNGQLFRFEMNLFGLTQHYYNKTCFLDMTSSPQVAAFFATTDYDWKTDTYSPILDEEHVAGILYYYSLDIDTDFKEVPLTTIGLQVFPRSGKQYGFLYRLTKEQDFNTFSRLQMMRFKHDPKIAQRIFDEFHGGKDLFPDDILMNHWKACNRDKLVLSNRTVLANQVNNPSSSVDDLIHELENLGYEIRDYIPTFTKDELKDYYAAIKKGFWNEFCSRIYIPGDNGSILNALKSLPYDQRYQWAFDESIPYTIDYNQGVVLKKFARCLK